VHNEQSRIDAFVKRGKRDRYREILSSPRQRYKFTSQLAHFTDFDPKYRVLIPGGKRLVDNIARELRKRHSPSIIFAISEDPALDQKELPLLEALRMTVNRGLGTVLSCIPGRLAFVETEDERFILERHDALERPEYIRFVIDRKDEESHVDQGIFQAVARALEWHTIAGCDREQLNNLEKWFGENLEKQLPSGVTRCAWASAGSRLKPRYPSPVFGRWFKASNGTASSSKRSGQTDQATYFTKINGS